MRKLAAVLFTLGVWCVSARAATHTVNTFGTSFDPRELTIQAGDTVTWNLFGHTSTSDTGVWDSGYMPTYSRVFNEVGVFPYHCIPHKPHMTGTITVVQAKTSTQVMLESSNSPSEVGEAVTFTATVVATEGGGTPSGTLTFRAGSTVMCSNVAMNIDAEASCTRPTLTAGTHSITASYSGDENFEASVSAALQQTVNEAAPPPVPAMFVATAISATEISLSWSTSSGATGYEVYRTTNRLNAYQLVAETTESGATDTMLTPGTTYLYRVRATGSGGPSADSPIDPATTIIFTDGNLEGVVVKAQHVEELQLAINAMRIAAALSTTSFTTVDAGMTILASHFEDMRTALDAARGAIGLAPLTHAPITAGETVISALHSETLRAGTQ
jgi:plastocyanin